MTAGVGLGRAAAAIGKICADGTRYEPDPPSREFPTRFPIELASPVQGKLAGFIAANRKTTPLELVTEGMFKGQTCAICGAGPSLAKAEVSGVDQIFACNSALPYLGSRATAGVGIDQTPGLLREWSATFDVPYFVASSCDPELIAHLKSQGRRVIFFHNAVGLEDEFGLYCRTWPPTFMCGSGFTVVSRFIGVAQWMGFERIDIYGADCALGDGDIAHANGEHVATAYNNPLIMSGEVNGRTWRTRPDMLMGAVDLARRAQHSGGRIRLIGDTLPVALLGKDEAFLESVCRQIVPGETPPLPT